MERLDLGALFARVTRRLVDAERPLLAAHGLSMWDYIAMSQLARSPAESQLALAHAIGHDKTRLITLLDNLERAGLLTRVADPADRRARIVQLTAAGERKLAAARADIRAMETTVLASIAPTQRRTLLAALPKLDDVLRLRALLVEDQDS